MNPWILVGLLAGSLALTVWAALWFIGEAYWRGRRDAARILSEHRDDWRWLDEQRP